MNPDIIILRADGSVGGDIRRKISTFCNVKPECVIENLTMPSLYQCPLMLHTNGLDDVVVEKLKLDVPPADLTEWKGVVSRIATRSQDLHHCAGGQVRQAARRLSFRDGEPVPRRF